MLHIKGVISLTTFDADNPLPELSPEIIQGLQDNSNLLFARGALAHVGDLWKASHELALERNATEAGVHKAFPKGEQSTNNRVMILNIASRLVSAIADEKMDEACARWIEARRSHDRL